MLRRKQRVIINIDFTHEKQSQECLAFGLISLDHFISNLKTSLYSARLEQNQRRQLESQTPELSGTS